MTVTAFEHAFEIGDIIVHKGDGCERKITEIRIAQEGALYQAMLVKEGDYNHAQMLVEFQERLEARYWKKEEPLGLINRLDNGSQMRNLLRDIAERNPKLFMDAWLANK